MTRVTFFGEVDFYMQHLRRAERVCHVLGRIFGPTNNVDLLTLQLGHDRLYAHAFWTDTSPYRIYVRIDGMNSDFRTIACFTSNGLDFNHTIVNLWHFQFKEALQKSRMGTGNDDLRSLGGFSTLMMYAFTRSCDLNSSEGIFSVIGITASALPRSM